ncbi:MAG: AsmA family protein [Alphaproteobacteria bacterium]|nr:AsmA family protein [Alphaproteobacteria bacterium]
MKKFILTVLLIIVVLACAFVYLLVRSLNSQSYQQQIIASVSELTGREMTVAGNTSFKWLPIPTLVMNNVAISNHKDSDKANMVTADSIQVQIEWNSLLKTPLVVKSVEVVNPTFYMERSQNNHANWNLPLFSSQDSNIDDSQFLGEQNTTSAIKIDRFQIKNGTIFYTNKITQKQLQINNLNGNLSISALKGPYQFEGSAKILDNTFEISINTDVIRNDMASKITAQIKEKNSQLHLDFNGEIFPADPKKIIWGDASFAISNPQPLFESFGFPVLNDALKQSVVGSLSVDITPVDDKLSNLILRFGNDSDPLAITTTLVYTPQNVNSPASFTGNVAINKLDYNAFKPYFDKLGWDLLSNNNTTLPNINTTLNVSEIIFPTGSVKNTSAELSFVNKQLSLTAGKAIIPGNVSIVFRANSGQKDGTPYLTSHISGETTNAEALFSFLNIKTQPEEQSSTVPLSKIIKQVKTDTHITLTPNLVSVQFDPLNIDSTKATGSIEIDRNNHKKITLNLNVDNLNVDTYTNWSEPKEKISLSGLPIYLKTLIENATGLKGWDASFQTTFNALTWHNLPIKKGTISGSVQNEKLTLSQVEFHDVATASLKANGSASSLGTQSATIDNLSFSFSAKQLPLFLERARLTSDLPLINKASETKLTGSITNADNMWQSNVMLNLNEATIKLNGSVVFVDNETRFKDFNVNVTHPNFHNFLTLINVDTTPVKNLNGELNALGTLNGTIADLSLTGADFSVGNQKLIGSLSYTDNVTKKLVVNASSPLLEGERFIPQVHFLTDSKGALSKKTFDFSKWDNWDIAIQLSAGRLSYKVLDLIDAKLGFSSKDKVFTLNQLSGIQRGNTNAKVNLSGQLSYVETPTLKADIELADLNVRPDFMIVNKFSYGGGKMGLKGSFSASGTSVADMIDNLNGNGYTTLSGGQFIGFDLEKVEPLVNFATSKNIPQKEFDAQMNRLMKLGKTPVESLQGDFSIAKGVARFMDMTLKTPTAIATPTQIVWNIPASILNITAPFQINGLSKYPPIILTIEMNRGKKMHNMDYSELSNVISGHVQQILNIQEKQQKEAEAAAIKQEQENKILALKQAVTHAQDIVPQIAKELQEVSDDKVQSLVQNALDALSVVNQLMLKEDRNDEQNNMLLEQSKLAVIKINEAQKAAADAPMDYRQPVKKMEKAAIQMVSKMSQLQSSLPHIAIIPKLTAQSQQNLNILQSAKMRLENAPQNIHETILAEVTNAYKAIETAYANVMRFDTSSVVYTPTQTSQSGVRGTISK